jgi:tRNA (mo5U34)-methyltransferase
MRNVWFIPSIDMLINWLKRVGFSQINCVDVSTTTIKEQRSTEWMQFESYTDFIDPDNPSLTVEGYPAPLRVFLKGIAG